MDISWNIKCLLYELKIATTTKGKKIQQKHIIYLI